MPPDRPAPGRRSDGPGTLPPAAAAAAGSRTRPRAGRTGRGPRSAPVRRGNHGRSSAEASETTDGSWGSLAAGRGPGGGCGHYGVGSPLVLLICARPLAGPPENSTGCAVGDASFLARTIPPSASAPTGSSGNCRTHRSSGPGGSLPSRSLLGSGKSQPADSPR